MSSRGKSYVKIPKNIYDLMWDFVMNCCVIHKEESTDFFYRWESDRIDDLANFFDEQDAINA